MIIFIAFLVVLLLAVVDGAGSAVMLIFTLLLGMLFCMTLPQKQRSSGFNLLAIVFSIYVSVAYMASLSFSSNGSFYVSDPQRYISTNLSSTSFKYTMEDLYDCYFGFSDSNLLYNAYLNVVALIMNNHLGGMSVFGLTLCQTLFGILSSVVMYRIFLRHFDAKFAFRQVLLFSLLSPFLLYSSVIVRDICICFFFLLAFDVVDRKFSIWGVIQLALIMLLVWGIRLYSGLFISAFIWYYLYKYLHKSSLKPFGTIISVILGIAALLMIFSSSLMEQTTEELASYEELSMERSDGGITSKLMTLPSGVRHVSIVLFAMIRPLPPFDVYSQVESFSNFVISTLALVSGFFWFVCFYSYVGLFIFNHQLKRMKSESVLFLAICFLFLMGNAVHPDVRRMTPVFPALYMLFSLGMIESQNINKVSLYKEILTSTYIIIAFALLLLP